ncbi:MAG: PaaI family thioesterase [Alphaproteobacteria bacterium]|nr:PaaI family thioesterase [Alphaproteobacteria bacterium]
MTAPVPPVRANTLTHDLGIEYREEADGISLVVLEVKPRHLNYSGSIHGGTLCTIIDVAIARAIRSAIPPNSSMATINLSVSFLGGASSGRLEARGRVRKVDDGLATGEAEVSVGDQVVARGVGTWVIRPPRVQS